MWRLETVLVEGGSGQVGSMQVAGGDIRPLGSTPFLYRTNLNPVPVLFLSAHQMDQRSSVLHLVNISQRINQLLQSMMGYRIVGAIDTFSNRARWSASPRELPAQRLAPVFGSTCDRRSHYSQQHLFDYFQAVLGNLFSFKFSYVLG